VTVEAAPILANPDDFDSINGRTGGTTASVLINDTLNGAIVNPTDVTLTQVDPDPSSPLTLNANGTITIAANTPAGTYELEYRICEILNPSNCSTAIATVTVEAAPIVANPDDFDSINGRTGGTTASVLINDTLNGTPVNPADVTLSLVDGDSELTLNANGTITIAPNTPAGTYELEYRICENLNAGNCSTAIATVTVEAAPILANPDDFDSINGRIGGTTASVLINDTLNGAIVNPTDVTLTQVDPDPSSPLTLNANGTITIAPNTPAGTYELEYRICENLNPSNCSTAIATVTVEAAPIVANPDDFDSINGRTGGTTASVLINDTLNGTPVNPTDVTLSLVDGDSELTLSANGTITIAPNTPSGTYELEYRICENLNSGNCSTAIATVTVEAAPIVANPDDFDSINGRIGGTTASVLINDTLNGAIVNPTDVTLTQVDPDPSSPLTLNANGTISIAANTPAGTYELEYSICENLNPSNCSTAIATVTVEAAPIVANPDDFDSINGRTGGTTASVLINDTLNGTPVNPADVTLSLVDGDSELTLNANGTITIAPNTPSGTYELEYRICENLNSGNCSTAIATVTVEAAPILANPDDFDSINGRIGGTTASVLINDTLNGIQVNPTDVTLSLVDGDSELTLNSDGTIGIAPNTPAGTYELEYRICENLNPSNCSTAIATVTVEAAPIVANPDNFDSINGRIGGTTASVLINDTLNGAIVNPTDVTLSLVDGDSELTLNANGTISVLPNTPAGTYELEYRICENLNPSNCSTAIATVTVEAAPIVANPDDFDSINGRIGGTTASVLINDTLNGAIVNPADVTLSLV
ncbi:hypothetical protein, partial [Belliella kenyensis]